MVLRKRQKVESNKNIERAKEDVRNLLVKMRIEDPKVTVSAAYIKYAKDKGYKSWNDLVIDYSKPHRVV